MLRNNSEIAFEFVIRSQTSHQDGGGMRRLGSSNARLMSYELALAVGWDKKPLHVFGKDSRCPRPSKVLPHSEEIVTDLLAASDLLPAQPRHVHNTHYPWVTPALLPGKVVS